MGDSQGSLVATPPAIAAVGIYKSFGGVHALVNASLEIRFGEIHALVGENGAGKSTLIKVLSGVIRPDRGIVSVEGREVKVADPLYARRLGIGTVFQELTLLPWMTVADNLMLDDAPRGRSGLIQRRKLADRAGKLLADYGIEHINPREVPADLSVADRQIIEIVRALQRKPRIVFLDEPTAALPAREVDWLFKLVKELRAEGCAVVFTSHRWKEVEALAENITVFRSGRHVATRPRLEEAEAVTLMTGRKLGEMYPSVFPEPADEVVLQVEDLCGEGVEGVSFSLRRGEILGVGGLAGQGQRELFMTLYGAQRPASGKIKVKGRRVRIRRPSDAIRVGMGIALVPEDRKGEGLLLPLPVRDNLTLPVLGQVARGGLLRRNEERRMVAGAIDRLKIVTRRPNTQAVGTLSGGNQQKVLVGRWLLAQAEILLLFDVTRGVDAATKHDLYQLIVNLLEEGRSILFYSSETEETAQLCRRVFVMREGRFASELRDDEVEAEALVAASVMGSSGG